MGDGHDDGRDILAFYQRYEGNDVRLRVDLLDLKAGWQGNVNLYVAIDCAPGGAEWLPDFLDVRTGNPWEICLALYADVDVAGTTCNVYDSGYGTGWNGWFGGSYWNTELDAVEMTIPRDLPLTGLFSRQYAVRIRITRLVCWRCSKPRGSPPPSSSWDAG